MTFITAACQALRHFFRPQSRDNGGSRARRRCPTSRTRSNTPRNRGNIGRRAREKSVERGTGGTANNLLDARIVPLERVPSLCLLRRTLGCCRLGTCCQKRRMRHASARHERTRRHTHTDTHPAGSEPHAARGVRRGVEGLHLRGITDYGAVGRSEEASPIEIVTRLADARTCEEDRCGLVSVSA